MKFSELREILKKMESFQERMEKASSREQESLKRSLMVVVQEFKRKLKEE